MKPTTKFRSFLLASCAVLALSSSAHAQLLYWDGTSSTTNADGGTGTWDNLTTFNWDTRPYAGANSTWDGAANSAFFGGTAGTVSLASGGITTLGLTFNTTAYFIQNNTLTFGGSNNTVALNNGVTAATINSAIGTSTANMTFTAQNPLGSHTLTFGGAGGWTGTTLINAGITLQLNSASTALLTTSSITLNGGSITQNATAPANRISDSAAITSYGGTLSTSNTAGAVYNEVIGPVTLTRGLTNFVHITNFSANSQTLTLSGLNRIGGTNTSAVNFAAAGGLSVNDIIVVTGATNTTAGQIIGPWATTGNTSGANDYAIYTTGGVVSQAGGTLVAGGEAGWSAPANAYNNDVVTQTLTGTRTITALRNTAATATTTLATSANLETYGILNGAITLFTVAATGTGSLSTPTGGGYLHLNAGNATTGGAMTISAPITNNSGTVSVVKSGLGTLTLTGTNTFTGGIVVNSGSVVVTPGAANSFVTGATGADIINGGTLTYSSANAWGVTGRNTTFNGTGTLTSSVAYAGGTLTVNADANAAFTTGGTGLSYVTTTGSGMIINNASVGAATLNLGNASGFTGTLQHRRILNTNAATTTQFSSLGDGGALQFTSASTESNNDSGLSGTFAYNGTGTLTFNTRQVQLLNRLSSNWETRDSILANNSANGSNNWIINTDLLVTGGRGNPGAQSGRLLVLSGTNTDANAFNGIISNGTNANGIGVSKTGTGTWTLGGNNTYTGATSLGGGGTLTLSGDNSAMTGSVTVDPTTANTRLNINTATAIGTGTLAFSGGASADTVRLDNTSAGTVNVTTNNAFTLNRNFTFIGTQSLNLGNMTTTLGGLGAGGQRSITVTDKILTFGGAIGQASATVSGITKAGPGTLVLSGNNSYGANTTVSAGTLQLNGNANGLGFGGNQINGTIGTTSVTAGAVLDLKSATGISESITLNGTGISSAGALVNTGTALTLVSGVTGLNLGAATTGTGYSSPPTVSISGTGAGATAIANLGLTLASFGSATVTSPTGTPIVTISGGGGTGATATVTNAGVVTLTNPGFGYTSAPSVTVSGLTAGSITFGSVNATNFTVSGVQMTAAGSGYTGTPTYSFTGGGGSGATPGVAASASVTLASNSSIGGTGDITIDSPVGETGGVRTLTKVGANTVKLSGVNNYTGATTVSAGTLVVNGSITSNTTVSAAAALGGTGTVTGTASFADTSIFAWDLSIADPTMTGSANTGDSLAVTGNLTDGGPAGGSVFNIILSGTQTFADNFWNAGHSWTSVLTSGNSLALETLFTSFSYSNASGAISAPGGGSGFTLSGSTLNFTAIPEPTSALAGLLLGAGLLRRRRSA